MGRLRDWWQRLTGGSHESPPEPPPARAREPEPPPADGLQLADDNRGNPPSRTGAAGFDPYSSDAGYAKPHSWERVDHD